MTAIHFLLGRNDVSRWHRVKSDKLWHFCEGDALELHEICTDLKTYTVHRLGSDTGGFFTVIRAGHWQAARTTGEYSLASCVVGPGFEYEDFQMLSDSSKVLNAVLEKFPRRVFSRNSLIFIHFFYIIHLVYKQKAGRIKRFSFQRFSKIEQRKTLLHNLPDAFIHTSISFNKGIQPCIA